MSDKDLVCENCGAMLYDDESDGMLYRNVFTKELGYVYVCIECNHENWRNVDE